MRKIYITALVFLVAVLFILPAAGQESEKEIDILDMELGMVTGYDFGTDAVAQTQRFALNFNLTESLTAGFLFQQAGTTYTAGSYLTLDYTVAEKIGVGLMYGTTGGTASSGLNASYELLSNEVEAFNTAMWIDMEYLLEDVTASIDQGVLGMSLNLKIGF